MDHHLQHKLTQPYGPRPFGLGRHFNHQPRPTFKFQTSKLKRSAFNLQSQHAYFCVAVLRNHAMMMKSNAVFSFRNSSGYQTLSHIYKWQNVSVIHLVIPPLTMPFNRISSIISLRPLLIPKCSRHSQDTLNTNAHTVTILFSSTTTFLAISTMVTPL